MWKAKWHKRGLGNRTLSADSEPGGPPGWGLGGGPITHHSKTKQITETLNIWKNLLLGPMWYLA